MSVYVDHAKHSYRGMRMSHMIADTEQELHQMADRIGVARRHYQKDASTPHYDVCQSKRALAVQAGALECDIRSYVTHIRRLRAKREALTW